MNNESTAQDVKETLPLASNATPPGQTEAFKSKTKLPKGAHGKSVARAVDRIVRSGAHTSCITTTEQGGIKACRCPAAQATATLLPVERDYVVTVVKEFRTWAQEQTAKEKANTVESIIESASAQ